MPVMPAPTITATSERLRVGGMVAFDEDHPGAAIVPTGWYTVPVWDRNGRPLAVPFAMKHPDRAPKERYYDPEFYRLETEQLWSRTWQMACRLEEIPQPYDFTEYEILDQPIVVVRTEDGGAQAFQNACRHRGVKVAEGRGSCPSGFTCPFHGWCYGPDGKNTAVTQRRTFNEHNLDPAELDLVPVRCETWGGCAWINLDDDCAAAARVHRAVRDGHGRLAAGVDARRVVVRLPAAGELEDRRRGVSWSSTTCCSRIRSCASRAGCSRGPASRSISRRGSTGELQYLHTMSDGMAGMVHAKDVRIAEELLRDIALPDDPKRGRGDLAARAQRCGRRAGIAATAPTIPDLNALADAGHRRLDVLLLPALLRAADVQQRFVLPLPAARPGGDADGDLVADPLPGGQRAGDAAACRRSGTHDDPRWPPIPAQDFSNLPEAAKRPARQGF